MQVTEDTKATAQAVLDYWDMGGKHDQGHWVDAITEDDLNFYTAEMGGKEVNFCGTSMCAAGTTIFLSTTTEEFKEKVNTQRFISEACDVWSEEAAKILGLDENEAMSVFYADESSARTLMTAIANGDPDKFQEFAQGPDWRELF